MDEEWRKCMTQFNLSVDGCERSRKVIMGSEKNPTTPAQSSRTYKRINSFSCWKFETYLFLWPLSYKIIFFYSSEHLSRLSSIKLSSEQVKLTGSDEGSTMSLELLNLLLIQLCNFHFQKVWTTRKHSASKISEKKKPWPEPKSNEKKNKNISFLSWMDEQIDESHTAKIFPQY